MRVSASVSSGFQPPRREPPDPAQQHEPPRAQLPAVIPAARRAVQPDALPRVRPAATVLAQLVAGTEDLPISRARRRADPAEGAQYYRAMADLAPVLRRPSSRVF